MTNHHKNLRHITIHSGPEQSLGFLLWRISTKWRSTLEQVLKSLDLTHPQYVILATTAWLTQDNIRVSQVDIARLAGLDSNTTSQVIRALEAKGLIDRIRLIDERSKNPRLTVKGLEILVQAMPAVESADEGFFSALSTEDQVALLGIFKRLAF